MEVGDVVRRYAKPVLLANVVVDPLSIVTERPGEAFSAMARSDFTILMKSLP